MKPTLENRFDALGATALVEFFTSSYAPCMVQVRLKSEQRQALLSRIMAQNGCTDDEDTALLSFEDAATTLQDSRLMEALENGWPVRVRLDSWTARHLFGYQSD